MASNWIMVSGDAISETVGQGATEFGAVAGHLTISADEDQRQVNCAVAYTWQNSGCRVKSNNVDNATTVTARVNAADQTNQQISIAANTTGWFKDTSGTVAVSAGDLVSWGYAIGAGAGGDEVIFTTIVADFEHASLDRPSVSTGTSREITAASSTEYFSIVGTLGNGAATEADVKYTIRQGVTFSNLRIFIDTHDSNTGATFDLREDGVSSSNLSISISSGATGEFEDTDSEAVSTGSDVNYRMVASGAIRVASVQMLQAGDVTGRILGAGDSDPGTHAPGSTNFLTLEGGTDKISATELDAQIEMPVAVTVTDMFVRVPTNSLSTAATTVGLRVGGADSVLDLSISAGSTGVFEDSSSLDLAVDALVCWELAVASGGSGSIIATLIGLEQGQTAVVAVTVRRLMVY